MTEGALLNDRYNFWKNLAPGEWPMSFARAT